MCAPILGLKELDRKEVFTVGPIEVSSLPGMNGEDDSVGLRGVGGSSPKEEKEGKKGPSE